jgi:predicted transcriptional regulator
MYTSYKIGIDIMIRTQVYLTQQERQALGQIAQYTGTMLSVLIREAIDQFISHNLKQQQNKKLALQAAKGLWAQRDDLPDFAAIRESFNERTDDK